jgi:hypothetical protein
MGSSLTRHLPVATCIGCGARSHSAECSDGCADRPLDVVDVGDLAAVASRAEDLEERVTELRALARMLASETPLSRPTAQERARAALRMPVPAEPDVEIIQAWGCPDCGRIDAPQPCLGVCIRRAGLVADISEFREFATRWRGAGGGRSSAQRACSHGRDRHAAARPGATHDGDPAVPGP